MVETEHLFKVLALLLFFAFAIVCFVFLRFHKLYRKMPVKWGVSALLLIHLTNCLILVGIFQVTAHLREIFMSQNGPRTETIEGLAVFLLFFLLGIPFVYFYTRSQFSLIKIEEEKRILKEECHSHKLDVINFMSRLMDELPDDLKDHAAKTSLIVGEFCEFLNMELDAKNDIVFAAVFHNVGAAFDKGAVASDPKAVRLNQYAELGAVLFSKMHIYKNAEVIIRHLNEMWDGSGRPDKLTGTIIPVGSRVIAMASRYECLVSGRNGKPKLSPHDALEKLSEGSDTEFGPEMLGKFITYITKTLHSKENKKSFGDRVEFD